MSRSYCVVGGGVSGLVAAYRLRMAVGDDAVITLFDPAERLGGVLHTGRVGGQLMDLGAEAFVLRRPVGAPPACGGMPALLSELGLSGRQRTTTGVRPLIYSQQKLHPLPSGTVTGIPSLAGAMAGLVDDATLARIGAEATRPFPWQPGSDPTVAELVADRFGTQTVTRSVDPLLGGVYAGSAATIGLRAAAPAVAAALDRGAPSLTDAVRQGLPPASGGPVFGALDGGYQVLIDELVRRSRLRWVRAAVTGLDPGWELRDEAGGRWQAEAVILAIPPTRLSALLENLAPRTVAAANRIGSASSAVVALAVPADTPLPQCSGVLVASGESLRAKAITLSTRKWGLGGALQLLRLSFGRFGDEVAAQVCDEQLLDWAVEDLSTVFDLTVDPVDMRIKRWIDAMPQYGPGHAELVAELRAGLPSTVGVAGSYLDGIGVPACIVAAGRAVSGVLKGVAAQMAR